MAASDILGSTSTAIGFTSVNSASTFELIGSSFTRLVPVRYFSWFLRLCVSVVAQKILLLPYLLIQKEKYVLQTYHFMIRRFALEFCLRLNLIKPRATVVQFPSVYTILQTSKKQILRWNLWILALDEMAEQFVWNLLRLQFSSILGRLISPWLLVITMGYVLYIVSSSFL